MPARSRQLVDACKAGQNRNASTRVTNYDDHAIRSFEVCGNGMLSGLSSRYQPWFKLTLEDRGLMKFHPVKVWLDEVSQIMYSAFAASNFYEAALSVYMEMSAFGTGANVMVSNPRTISVNHPLTVGEYGIALGEDGRPDTLGRTYKLTARQLVATYVADRFDSDVMHWDRVTSTVRTAWDAGNYENAFAVHHLIEPNPAYVPGRLGAVGKAFRSLRWQGDQSDKGKFLSTEGFDDQPFMAPRWETLGGDVWGTGRGRKALPSMRALQLEAKRSLEATDFLVRPPTMGTPNIDNFKLVPGRHTTVASADFNASGVKTIYEIPYQALDVIDAKVARQQRNIDRMTYADMFLAITNMEGVQPRNVEELVRRHEEQLTQLGPVTDRVNGEFLQPGVDRMFGILHRGGQLPEAPEEIEDMEIGVQFVSVLAQAQRMMGISQIERGISFVGSLSQALPEAIDNLDPDAIVEDYWERTGAAAVGLRDPKKRDALRAQRQRMQSAERAAALAPAVQQAAQGAQLLSETDSGGESLLDRVMPA
jgi:hypothetical protein